MNGQQRTARWLDCAGGTFTSAELSASLTWWARLTSFCDNPRWTADELERTFPVGSVYSNGGIWFQRVNDETEVSDEQG